MAQVQSIVVGVDFGDASRAALAAAMSLAARTRADVHAVHVIDTLAALELDELMASTRENARERLVVGARDAWRALVTSTPEANRVSFDVRTDNRLAGIFSVAEMRDADLVVLGAGNDSNRGRTGSMAIPCARHAKRDVLVVRSAPTWRRVLACVDFSTNARHALDRAVQFAAATGASLHVLHVLDEPWRALRAPAAAIDDRTLAGRYAELIERRMHEFTRDLGDALGGATATCSVVRGADPAASIEQHARDISADVVVVGTRGRTTLRDLLLGSVAERALRESTCSVLVVKPTLLRPRLGAEDARATTRERVGA